MSMTREEAIKQLERLYDYCENMRSGDNDFAVWERDCEAIKIALSALRPVSREQVERIKKEPVRGGYDEWWCPSYTCPECGCDNPGSVNFCNNCGCPFTDGAVDILLKRLEALRGDR